MLARTPGLAVAVALAAAMSWRLRTADRESRAKQFFAEVLRYTPESQVRGRILVASEIPADASVDVAAKVFGNGFLVTAPDTVPFTLRVAARHLDNFTEALGTAICTGGDCDTNSAIVGGIVAVAGGRESIPADWIAARESLGIG